VLAPVAGTVTAVLQVLAFSDVVGQVDRAFIGGHRFLVSPELVKQVHTRGPGRLEAAGVLAGLFDQIGAGRVPVGAERLRVRPLYGGLAG
jgi:hypothetical protein